MVVSWAFKAFAGFNEVIVLPPSLQLMQDRVCLRTPERLARCTMGATMPQQRAQVLWDWGPLSLPIIALGDIPNEALASSRRCGDVRRLELLGLIWWVTFFRVAVVHALSILACAMRATVAQPSRLNDGIYHF